MWPYWLLFCIPLVGVLIPARLNPAAQNIAWFGITVFFTLLIGLRYQVGGDWFSYEVNLLLVQELNLTQSLGFKDPGYYAMNWLVTALGGDIYAVNLICGGIVMLGVALFCRRQPNPSLALLVAVPYLIVVVAMGYTRQAAALGFAMLGLAALGDGRARRFVVWILIGALFHKSAVLLLPIAALSVTKRRLWTFFWVGITAVAAAGLLVFEHADALWRNYVEADYESSGGLIRVIMNVVPAVLYLAMRKYITSPGPERNLWTWVSICCLLCLPLVLISSTAVDRVALYFIPIQLFVFSRLPNLFSDRVMRTASVYAVAGYYGLVLWVWLNYARHADAWLPYQFAPFIT